MLSEQVGQRYIIPDLEIEAGRYLSALGPTLNRIGFSFDPFRRRNVYSLRRALARLTTALPVHLVIILDDLDRLQKPELLATLRLMKLAADLPNLTYVVGIHLQIVVEQVLSDQPGYLDKFIDMVVPLSVLDRADISAYLRREANQIARASTSRQLRGAELLDQVIDKHIDAVPTLRDAKRVLTGFTSALEQLPGMVNAGDVMMLEILRWRAPRVWQAISDRPEYFHRVDTFTDPLDRALLILARRGDRAWNDARQQYYGEILEGVSKDRRLSVGSVLQDVFPYVAHNGTDMP